MQPGFFENQSVLVTGGAGLIGSNLIPSLIEAGARVRATFHRKAPQPRHPHVEYLRAELTTAEDCAKAVRGVDYVFHCASNTPGAAMTVSAPLEHVTSNLVIDARMFEAAYRAGAKKFLWLGSVATAYPPVEHPVREEEMFSGDPHEKYFFVGWSKRITEILARMYGEKLSKPMTAIVLRLTYVYGPHDNFDPKSSHVIPGLIKKVVERQEPLEVWGTGEEIRDTLYVGDAVEAMLEAMARVEHYDVFNIGLGRGYNVKEMLELILDLDGYAGAKVVFNTSKPSMIPVRLVDISKANRLLGFKPRVDLQEGLRRTIEWYRESRNLPGR